MRGVKKSDRHVYVAFDEWNVWYKNTERDGGWTVGPHLLEEVYNLEDSLVCAQYLSSFLRHADVVKIACIAQIVNVIAPILTRPDGVLLQSTYYPLQLFSQHARGVSLRPIIDGPSYSAGTRGEVPVLDVSAAYDAGRSGVSVFIVNRDASRDAEVQISFGGRSAGPDVDAVVLTGDDPKSHNTWERPDTIAPKPASAVIDDSGSVHVVAPSLGLTVVRVQLDQP